MKISLSLLLVIFANLTIQAQEALTIPRLEQVNSTIFRSGRASQSDLTNLIQEKTIKTILNIEDNKQAISDERKTASDLHVNFITNPVNSFSTPTDQQVNQIMHDLLLPENQPILVHCHHGEDRTGLIIGLFRVEVQGWTARQAYQEMLDHGFHTALAGLDNYFKRRTGLK